VLERMRGPVFDEAVTLEGLGRVKVDAETGTVVWPDGADLSHAVGAAEEAPGVTA
jgi:hypothetical protein